jgi:hypothetical protein
MKICIDGFAFNESKLMENQIQLVNVSTAASLNLEAFCGLQLLG